MHWANSSDAQPECTSTHAVPLRVGNGVLVAKSCRNANTGFNRVGTSGACADALGTLAQWSHAPDVYGTRGCACRNDKKSQSSVQGRATPLHQYALRAPQQFVRLSAGWLPQIAQVRVHTVLMLRFGA